MSRARITTEGPAVPEGALSEAAFDLWALLQATAARIDELTEAHGFKDSADGNELTRLVCLGARMAHAIANEAMGLPA